MKLKRTLKNKLYSHMRVSEKQNETYLLIKHFWKIFNSLIKKKYNHHCTLLRL